jgi:hypothetical protein
LLSILSAALSKRYSRRIKNNDSGIEDRQKRQSRSGLSQHLSFHAERFMKRLVTVEFKGISRRMVIPKIRPSSRPWVLNSGFTVKKKALYKPTPPWFT